MSDFWRLETVLRSRKRHRCYECEGLVDIGDPYIRGSGVWEGEFFAQATHFECANAASEMIEVFNEWDEDRPKLWDMQSYYPGFWRWLFWHHPVAAEYVNRKRFIADCEALAV